MNPFARRDVRPLVIAAHVDDDGVGFGIGLREQAATTSIVYLTDSAPRDPQFFTTPCSSREAYAAQRRQEAERVAAHVGVAPDALHWLGAVDMESFRDLPRLQQALCTLADGGGFDAIWSPAYDGGHPDHDVAAFLAARLAARLAVPHFEFALYRYHKGFDPFRFGRGDEGYARLLSAEEIAFKRALIELYSSQAPMVRRFDLRCERYRPAPTYDFQQRPVAGPTLYESWRWPVTAQMLVAEFVALDRAG